MQRFSVACLLLIFSTSLPSHASPLCVEDFNFEGPLGCQGAQLKAVGENHFLLTPGSAPEHDTWNNKVQFTLQNAKGNALILDVEYPVGKPYGFNQYYASYSYDGKTWRPVHWEHGQDPPVTKDRLVFPRFSQDTVYVGHQTPMSYEESVALQEGWAEDPAATLIRLGESLEGRSIYRLSITDPESPYPAEKKWCHYFANQHPGEHNAQWRMAGMIEWLLSEAGRDLRHRSLCHFILMTSVDAPSKGWYRVNKEGVDMNRSYRRRGAHKERQAHEAYIAQQDLETLMASPTPPSTLWSMHTWQGPVECLVLAGPEIGAQLPEFKELVRLVDSFDDARDLVEPLYLKELKKWDATHWDVGPHLQFGLTTVLCEGGGSIYTKEDNMDSGVVLIRGLNAYYTGTKP